MCPSHRGCRFWARKIPPLKNGWRCRTETRWSRWRCETSAVEIHILKAWSRNLMIKKFSIKAWSSYHQHCSSEKLLMNLEWQGDARWFPRERVSVRAPEHTGILKAQTERSSKLMQLFEKAWSGKNCKRYRHLTTMTHYDCSWQTIQIFWSTVPNCTETLFPRNVDALFLCS